MSAALLIAALAVCGFVILLWLIAEVDAWAFRRRERLRQARRPGYLRAIPPHDEERPSIFEGRR